jgi:hypothetical protein
MATNDGKRMAIFGKSGSGKTELALSMTRDARRLLVFDPKGSWAKKPGFEVLSHFSQVKPFLNDMGDGDFRAVYMPEALAAVKRLSTLGNMLLDYQQPFFKSDGGAGLPITLAVDELADAFPLALPGGYPGFAEVCQKGREFGINVIGITQRPASVHPAFRGNLDRIAAFNFSFVNDRKAVALAMEDEAVMDELTRLEPFHFIAFDGSKWEIRPPAKLAAP